MLEYEKFVYLIQEIRDVLVFYHLPVSNRSLNIIAQEELLPMFRRKKLRSLTTHEFEGAVAFLREWVPSPSLVRKLRLAALLSDQREGVRD